MFPKNLGANCDLNTAAAGNKARRALVARPVKKTMKTTKKAL
jgi:hypothetical protein